MSEHKIVIVGGGAAGLSIAARLTDMEERDFAVTVIEPSEDHYYQPIWTLVGAGVFDKEISKRQTAEYVPDGATWLKDRATGFRPDDNVVETADNGDIDYDYLVVTAGIELKWDMVDGLADAIGEDGVCSNYSYDTVESTWETLRHFRGGNAIFTFPDTAIKCAGAPQKIMWLAEHWMRRNGVREDANVIFASSTAGIFGVEKYARTLDRLVEERDITPYYEHNLTRIDAANKKAYFQHIGNGQELELDYEMLHVTPPQGPFSFIADSPLADEDGWVEVDKYTTQHVRYSNVFSIGDCSSLPTSKTGAAVRKEVPVMVENLLAEIDGETLEAEYNGYASCPLVTGYGRLVLCEFDYEGNPDETFPFDQSEERYSMYALKAYGLPEMYWNGMLRGRM